IYLTDDASPFFKLRHELMAFDYFLHHLSKKIIRKASAGRKENYDLVYLVLEVAKLLTRHGIKLTSRGKQFKAILKIIFGAVDEDERQIRNAIKYAWTEIEKFI